VIIMALPGPAAAVGVESEDLLLALDRVNPPQSRLVRLNVGETFTATVDRHIFSGPTCPPGSLLAALFGATRGRELQRTDEGDVFISRDGPSFALLLRFLVEGGERVPEALSAAQIADLRAEAAFWRIPIVFPNKTLPSRVFHQRDLDALIAERMAEIDMLYRAACEDPTRDTGIPEIQVPKKVIINASFAGLNLMAASLLSYEFHFCDLRGADFSGCDMDNRVNHYFFSRGFPAGFRGCDFTGATVTFGQLQSSDVRLARGLPLPPSGGRYFY
jgi:hypothetical protein